MIKRLGIDENNKVTDIFYDKWNGEEYEVPDDFEENFKNNVPYVLFGGKILIDSAEQRKKELAKQIESNKEYLASTDYIILKISEFLLDNPKDNLPAEWIIIKDTREKFREEINQIEEELALL
jgi:GTPase SAR1 family protein